MFNHPTHRPRQEPEFPNHSPPDGMEAAAMQVCPEVGLPSLRKLLSESGFDGPDDICVSGCTCDSRRVQPGDLFVALSGARHEGHRFIAEAVQRGCAAVLGERPLPESSVPVYVVPDARTAYAHVCHALAGHPARQLKMVGITGTNGKTTTTCLVANILTEAGYKIGLLGTLGYLDGKVIKPSRLTTPDAETLASWLRRMVQNECTHAVLEVSSHALDQSRVAGLHFDAACLTNVSHDHLDYHGTMQEYQAAKSKLFDQLAPEGFAVLNADDSVSAGLLRTMDGPVLTVGIDSPAEITATPIEQHLSEQTFLLTAGSETVPVRTEMIGKHHIYNCLVAAAVGLTYGIDLPTVVRGLEGAGHVPGRLERLECGQPFGVFVDFAHTPDALARSLRALRQVTPGRLICLFGAGGDRDRQKRPLMAQAVQAEADLAILTSDNPRNENPENIIRDVLTGFELPGNIEVVVDRAEAIRWALHAASPGDCVLIAGKGHETVQIIGEEHVPLDDRQVAREWLYEVRPYSETSN